MSNSIGASKTVVIRTSRDTLGLAVVASAMTFALAYAVHAKHDRLSPPPAQEAQLQAPPAQDQQDWAGRLAEFKPPAATVPSEPLSSATLVVPKSQLALPTPAKVARSTRACDLGPCSTIAKASAPPRRAGAVADVRTGEPAGAKKSLLGMLNPLNHLPDVSIVGRPFTYAGGTVAGWFKRL